MSGGGKKRADDEGRSKRRKRAIPQTGSTSDTPTPSVDLCDLRFDVQLTSVNSAALRRIGLHQRLAIAIHERKPYETVVCKIGSSDEVVGAIAGVENLDLLMRCMGDGNVYE